MRSAVRRQWLSLLREESGQVFAWFVVLTVLFLGIMAFTIDTGLWLLDRRGVQNEVDAAVLAAVQELPATTDDQIQAAADAAQHWLVQNTRKREIDVQSECAPQGEYNLIRDGFAFADTDDDGSYDKIRACVRRDGYVLFSRLFGLTERRIGAVGAAEVVETQSEVPLDLLVVLDRTSSMSDTMNCGLPGSETELDCAKKGALDLLMVFDPTIQYVGLAVLGPSFNNGTNCTGANSPARGIAASSYSGGSGSPGSSNNGIGNWVPAGLTGLGAPENESYLNIAGTDVNNNSRLVKTIRCLTTSSVGTNLTTPIYRATSYLAANGRPGVTKGIIFMTDGQPNSTGSGSAGDHTCLASVNAATAAKNDGLVMYTIAYGLENVNCPDSSGAYHNVKVTRAMADMASDSEDDGGDGPGGIAGGCLTTSSSTSENADGDNFLCVPTGGDLASVFVAAATDFASSTSLAE